MATIGQQVAGMQLMEKLVTLCKRRGFLFQSSEVYSGLAGFWDYGPLGVELKRNIEGFWWDYTVRRRDNVVGEAPERVPHHAVVLAQQVGAQVAVRREDQFADGLELGSGEMLFQELRRLGRVHQHHDVERFGVVVHPLGLTRRPSKLAARSAYRSESPYAPLGRSATRSLRSQHARLRSA